jgi:hypothetical protein
MDINALEYDFEEIKVKFPSLTDYEVLKIAIELNKDDLMAEIKQELITIRSILSKNYN